MRLLQEVRGVLQGVIPTVYIHRHAYVACIQTLSSRLLAQRLVVSPENSSLPWLACCNRIPRCQMLRLKGLEDLGG